MALADAVQGAKRPTQIITWTQSDGEPEILTGATITGVILSARTRQTRAIDGTLTVTDGANGTFSWVYGDADVGEAGNFSVQFTAAFASAPTPAKTIRAKWRVHEQLTVSA